MVIINKQPSHAVTLSLKWHTKERLLKLWTSEAPDCESYGAVLDELMDYYFEHEGGKQEATK